MMSPEEGHCVCRGSGGGEVSNFRVMCGLVTGVSNQWQAAEVSWNRL